MGENIVWFRLVHLKIYKSRYPLLGSCFFIDLFCGLRVGCFVDHTFLYYMRRKKEYLTQKPTGSTDHDFMFRQIRYNSILV